MINNIFLVAIILHLFVASGCSSPLSETSTPSHTEPSKTEPPSRSQPEQKKMLIYCHPRKVQGPGDHFMWNFFTETVEKGGLKISDFKIDSLDVLPGGTIQADGFSADFAQKHKNEFDMVFVPDCGGEWYQYQDPVLNINGLYGLVSTALEIVKPKGKLILSKFIVPNTGNLVAAKFDGNIVNTAFPAALL